LEEEKLWSRGRNSYDLYCHEIDDKESHNTEATESLNTDQDS